MNRHFTVKNVLLVVLSLLLLTTGVALADSPTERENDIVGKQNDIYLNNQPPPTYNYSAQRDIVTQIYNITVPNLIDTWTVFYEMDRATDVCHSRGYPIPYGVQLTNPDYMRKNNEHNNVDSSVLPQPEPSGLYNNGLSTSASWVLCDYGRGGWEVVYAEGNVRTFAHPVSLDGNGNIVHAEGNASAVLDLSRVGSAGGNIDPNSPDQN